MDTNNNFEFLVSYILPESILDWFEHVKAIAFEGSVDYKNDPLIKEMEGDGWKIKDENMFGDGTGCGTILVFVK